MHKVHQLATALYCHAIKSLDKRGSDGDLLVERLASGGLGAGRIAWLTTRRILISLCCFYFPIFGGALVSVGTSWKPF